MAGWQWLEIRSLAQALVVERVANWPGAAVDHVVYCTARISGHVTTVLIRDGRRLARIVPEEDAWVCSPAWTAGFDTAVAKLPRKHRRLFTDAVRGHLIPAPTAGARRGDVPWPKRLRIHKIGDVYSLTWSFSGADGRALFSIGSDADGGPLLTWLAIGSHDIYQ